MRTIFLTAVVSIFTLTVNAQSLKEFSNLTKNNDTIAQKAMLEKWEKKGVNDPDFYVAAFNYYVNRARKEVLNLGTDEPDGESLALQDEEGNTAGFLGSKIIYSADESDQAISYINKGIAKFPDRLDLRFGKIYLLGELGNYGDYTKDIIAVVDHSAKIKNKWFWKEGKPLDDAKAFMLGSMQDYIIRLYNTENDALLDNMLQISETVLKYYPDHVESLSNISIVYMIKNKPNEALEALLKAEKLAPKDTIVLGNIAHAYVISGDKKNALKYYELVMAYGDENSKAFAKRQIEKNKL